MKHKEKSYADRWVVLKAGWSDMKRQIARCAAFLCMAGARWVSAAPACDFVSEVTMEDGTTRRVRPRGDEFFNWAEAEDGFAVARGESGRWQYATREKGRWAPSGMTPRQRGLEGRAVDPPDRTSPFAASSAAGSSPAGLLSAAPAAALGAPPAPAKALVILAAFTNQGLSYSDGTWTNTFFGASGKTIRTFYRQASKERFWFDPAEESQGATNDGLVRVTLAINHPNTASINDTVRSAVKEALIAADPYVDFAAFDANGDKALSTSELHLVVVFAGYEYSYSQSYMPYIWAHRWVLSTSVQPPTLDGISVASSSGGYVLVGERHATHAATIGVICHELGHDLGLPDLYDTDGSSDGVGAHCLMGSGNWGAVSGDFQGQTPVLPSAYCRQLIGLSDARTVSGEGVTNALLQISDSTNLADMVRLNTPNSQQYFLIENRRLSGFDAGLYVFFGLSSGGGLAVWHVDTSVSGNADDTRRLVDLEEAASPALDAPGSPYGRLQNYYYSGNATRFDETTFPSNLLYGGAAGLARLYNVSASGAQMTFASEDGASLEAAVDVGAAQAFASGGGAAWSEQASVAHDGRDAAQAGAVTSTATNSWMSTVVTGPVQVAFWWRHAAGASETLAFSVDGVRQAATGATGWTLQSHSVSAGAHTLRWNFTTTRKNGSATAAYVDQFTMGPIVTALAVDAPALDFPWQGGSAQLSLRNTGSASLLWQAAAPSWCSCAPSGGTLAAGSTQLVSVACATNGVWQAPRSGGVTVSATDLFGAPSAGSPVTLPLAQAAHPPPDPATVFSVR